jgi:phosphoglycerol transferase MdoB-like AlkP superfamily enzyme
VAGSAFKINGTGAYSAIFVLIRVVKGNIGNLTLNGNIYWALFLRLLLVMFLFTLCRIGFYLFNLSFFPGMTLSNFLLLLWGGLHFDLTALLYVNMLFILMMILPFDFRFRYSYQEVSKYLFFVLNGFALATNVADFIYYKFTLRRTTADVIAQFQNEKNMTGLFFQFLIDYWYAVLFWVFLIIVMVKLYNRVRIWGPQMKSRAVYYVSGGLALPLIAFLVVGGIRGGFKHSTRPITLSNAGEYVNDPRDISIVLNTPFALIRTVGKTKVQRVNYFDAAAVDTVYTPVHVPVDTVPFRKENVVVIILESFSREFFGAFNRDKAGEGYTGYTPFLDSLIGHSKTFVYGIANGRKSIDGLPSVMSSIPSMGVPYFLSPYSSDKINSLPGLLSNEGYHASFFHGAPDGSMGFKAFMNLAGVHEYYGMDEYDGGDDFDGLWGIWDEPFLQFYARKLNSFPQPFVSGLFSVSSHHPFRIPEQYEDTFKGGPLPIQKCIQYSDHALKRFFQTASEMPWYRNTLFVITADHTSSNIQFPEYRTGWGFYAIPIIFFKPDNSLAGMEDEIMQQTDIMPSVLGYLHYQKPYLAFGRDIFRGEQKPIAFNYKDNAYQLFMDEYLLQFDGTKTLGLYNFHQDKLMERNLVNERPEIVQIMERKIKAIIQQYNNRMIDDRLTVSEAP